MMQKALLFVIYALVGAGIVFAFFGVLSFPKIGFNVPDISSVFHRSFFSLVKAPSSSIRGNIETLSGEVNFQSRIATESAGIFSPQTIQQGEKLKTGTDGNASIIFDNAARVIMNPKTEIDFIQTLPVNIVMFQATGSATYKKLGPSPVSIRIFHLLVQAGTNTQVSLDDVKPVVKIQDTEGNFTVAFNDLFNVSQVMTIQAGKILTFNDKTRQAVVK